jgi:hypothetical protein
MSALCQKRTSKPVGTTSAIPPIPTSIFAPTADARNLVAAKKESASPHSDLLRIRDHKCFVQAEVHHNALINPSACSDTRRK